MEGGARAQDRILGTLRSAAGKGLVQMRHHLDARIDDVWSALTDPGRLAVWLGDIDGDLHLGGHFRAYFLASGWRGTGRVAACEPPHRLLVMTRHANGSEEQAIEATLTGDGDRTFLVWEERGMPLELLAPYGAGVQVHVEDLAAYLVGRSRCDADARFDELLPAYRDLAGSLS